jgi:antitoxin ParD1/3/4
MARNTSVGLGDHFVEFVDAQIDTGRYNSASDLVRAGLRLLEQHEAQLAALREALIMGETSGASTPFDFDRFIARKRRRKAQRWQTNSFALRRPASM